MEESLEDLEIISWLVSKKRDLWMDVSFFDLDLTIFHEGMCEINYIVDSTPLYDQILGKSNRAGQILKILPFGNVV